MSGLVRGAFQDPSDPRQPPRWARGCDLTLIFEGAWAWVNVQDVLKIVNECARSELGVGSILRLAKHDNKSRFILRGPKPDKENKEGILAYLMKTRCLPLQISASQGHGKHIASTFGDEQIAVNWLSTYTALELQGRSASFAGVPYFPWEACPPRLFHRTVRDAAMSITQNGLIAGYGGSGKIHNYFASCPLEEMTEGTAGVRANCLCEVVFSTKLALEAGCYLFTSKSDGVLCREDVPAEAVLYVRDTKRDEVIFSKVTIEETAAGEVDVVFEAEDPATAAVPDDDMEEVVVEDEAPEESLMPRTGHTADEITPEDLRDTGDISMRRAQTLNTAAIGKARGHRTRATKMGYSRILVPWPASARTTLSQCLWSLWRLSSTRGGPSR